MELPIEIWSNIIQKIQSLKECKKLYSSFTISMKQELKKIYKEHKKKLSINILIGVNDKLVNFNNDKFKIVITPNNRLNHHIKYVKYVKNLNTKIGIKDCIVSATQKGIIILWNAHTYEYIDEINILSDIKLLIFHPNKAIMATLSNELKIWKYTETGNIECIRSQNVGFDTKIIYFHPILSELYIFTVSNCNTIDKHINVNNWASKIYNLYIYNYDKDIIIFTDTIYSYFCSYNLYTPLKMNDQGNFECIKYFNNKNYIITLNIHDYVLKEMKCDEIFRTDSSINYLIIRNYIRIKNCIVYITNPSTSENNVYIYKQNIDKSVSIMYKTTTNVIFEIFYKNNLLIFIENNECKIINVDNLELEYDFRLIDQIDNSIIYDFCII